MSNTLNSNIIKEAFTKFQPPIYLDSKTNFFPIDFDKYICESKLKNTKTGEDVTDSYLTPHLLYHLIEKYPNLNSDAYTLYLPKGKHSEVFKQKDEDELAEVPLYVHILKSLINPYEFYIQYIHMYAYNGAIKVCKCCKSGAHYADKEHITVHVKYDPITNTSECVEIYYSRHNGGVWLDPKSKSNNSKDIIRFEDETHPVVFSAYHSHASYNEDKSEHNRFWCFTTDPCDKGFRWFSNNIIYIQDDHFDNNDDYLRDSMKWVKFKGDLGDGHVVDFPGNSWWTNPDEAANYEQNFWWCCDL